ncbi:glycosyl transferase family 90-domain-containing protein [Mycena capillaripes]|nr:glycosyl transferase family 90-domain-containing protein [Mycena capillaripes]
MSSLLLPLRRDFRIPGANPLSQLISQWRVRRCRYPHPLLVAIGVIIFTLFVTVLSPRILSSPGKKSVAALFATQSKNVRQARARYILKNNREPPPGFDEWFHFARAKKCLIDDYDRIHKDFEPFHRLAAENHTYFRDMINAGREMLRPDSRPGGITNIIVKDGKVSMPSHLEIIWDSEWKRWIEKFAHFLPDMDFFINGRDEPRVVFNAQDPDARQNATKLQDPTPFRLTPVPTSNFFSNRSGCTYLTSDRGVVSNAIDNIPFLRSSSSSDFTTDLWPMLSMTKLSPCFSDIIFPSPYYYSDSGYSGAIGQPDRISWAAKKNQLYWRGTSSGGHIIGNNYRDFTRFRLVQLASNHSDIIDAKISSWFDPHCTFDCDADEIKKEYDIVEQKAPREAVYNYKYLLDVDGNTFSGRYAGLLKSGSLVFKVHSPGYESDWYTERWFQSTAFQEFFSDWLRPYEHYIPVELDLSDLVDRLKWAMENEEEARAIQDRGMWFARRVLTNAQNDCYFAALLLEWARLQGAAAG